MKKKHTDWFAQIADRIKDELDAGGIKTKREATIRRAELIASDDFLMPWADYHLARICFMKIEMVRQARSGSSGG